MPAETQNKDVMKVLIVEDNRMFSDLLSEIVGIKYKKSISYTGKDAMDIYNVLGHEVVFLDINLPDMDGYSVLEEIKKKRNDAYVVIVTGSPTKDNVEKAVEGKVKGFLTKPFSRNQIVDHLEKASDLFGFKRI